MFEYRISSKLNQWPKVAVESWLKQFLKLLTVEEGFGVDFFDAVEFIEGLIFGFQFQRKYPAGDVRSVVLQHDFMLMSGIFTPIASMPHWAEILTYANPLRYFADAMRSIFLKGAGLHDNWLNLCCLLVQGLLFTFFVVKNYKKTN